MVTFKVDDKEIKASELRVEVDLGDGNSLLVVLTHEGIITDCFSYGDNIGTASITYDERFGTLTDITGGD